MLEQLSRFLSLKSVLLILDEFPASCELLGRSHLRASDSLTVK